MADTAFETPEAAALAVWPAAAKPTVVSVDRRGDRAEIVLDVNGDYRYWVYLRRDQQGWTEVNSSNGPNLTFQ